MEGFGEYEDLNDLKLKPRILKTLLSDRQLPSESDPLPDYVDVAKIVHNIKTFGLLSESCPQEANSRLAEDWADAVDAWVQRLLSLVSSPRAKKCWIGTCLLGVTCEECSPDRFLESYSVWLHKLLSNIQPASEYLSVKVASCASISHLLQRLAKHPKVKKDGTLHAGKLVQPVLELLNEDGSEAVLVGAAGLLSTIINLFPASIHHYYESAEAIIISKIISARCSSNLLKEYAYCLALLPKSRGDEDSWSSMMQDLLISININLSNALGGLEEETKCNTTMTPQESDPSASLEIGLMSEKGTYLEARRSKQLLMTIIPTLMLCCCTMLTKPYPVQVTVPIHQLLMLVQRVLKVNGSLPKASSRVMTVMQQEFVCTELPVLHLNSLDLLTAITKTAHSQLAPYAAFIIRLLKGQFVKCKLPALRVKVYSIIRTLLIYMGTGIALYIAEEVISNAFVDLNFSGCKSRKETYKSYSETATTKAFMQPESKKRKQVNIVGSSKEWQHIETLEMNVPETRSSYPISVKIAALEVLETLLTVGGAMRSEHLRSKVDLLIINVATNAYDGEWANEEENDLVPPGEPAWEDFQLAAFRALLASLLSQASVNPHYLSRGLELFRKGKQEIATKITEFCSHALLALEVLMHPRIIPLGGFPSSSEGSLNGRLKSAFSGHMYTSGEENSAPVSTPLGIDNLLPDDDLYTSWLGNGNEIEATENDDTENIGNAQERSVEDILKAITDYQEDHLPLDGYIGAEILADSRKDSAVKVDAEMGKDMDDITVETQELLDPLSARYVKVFADTCTSHEMQFKRPVSESGVVYPPSHDMKPSKDVLTIAGNNENASQDASAAIPVLIKADEEPAFSSVNESHADPCADIPGEDSKAGIK